MLNISALQLLVCQGLLMKLLTNQDTQINYTIMGWEEVTQTTGNDGGNEEKCLLCNQSESYLIEEI